MIMKILKKIAVSGYNILTVILKSNSMSIKKKNHFNINAHLLNKTLYVVETEIFS